MNRYTINKNKDGYEYIECLQCNMKSYNKNDIEHKYCGNCHEFLDTPCIENLDEESKILSAISYLPLILTCIVGLFIMYTGKPFIGATIMYMGFVVSKWSDTNE